MDDKFDICCGVDVGKFPHHLTAIDSKTGEILVDQKVGQSESDIRSALEPIGKLGKTRLVVDQPGNMSSLLFAVAKSIGISLGFLTPRAMSQAINLYGGELKTDAHDAFVIAEVSAGLPKLIKPLAERDEANFQLSVLMSYDRQLTSEATRTCNGIHELLLSVNPALERFLGGKRIQSSACLLTLERYGGPVGLTKAGRGNVRRWARGKKRLG